VRFLDDQTIVFGDMLAMKQFLAVSGKPAYRTQPPAAGAPAAAGSEGGEAPMVPGNKGQPGGAGGPPNMYGNQMQRGGAGGRPGAATAGGAPPEENAEPKPAV